MKIPKTIHIGGVTYKIQLTTPKKNKKWLYRDKCELYGSVDLLNHIIYIDRRYKDMIPFVLFHELIHATICEVGQSEVALDEAFIRPLSHMLYNCLKQAGFVKI